MITQFLALAPSVFVLLIIGCNANVFHPAVCSSFLVLVSFGLPSVRLPCILPFEIFFGFFDLDLEPLCRCVSFI